MTDEELVEYYEGLMGFLDDHLSCLDELIMLYEESLEAGDD